jgi:hypothetical protein
MVEGKEVSLYCMMYSTAIGFPSLLRDGSPHLLIYSKHNQSHIIYVHCVQCTHTYEHKVNTPRVPQYLYPRLNWDPHPLSLRRVFNVSPPKLKEGKHTRLRARGWGSPNSDDWRKSLALCLFCAYEYHVSLLSLKLLKRLFLKESPHDVLELCLFCICTFLVLFVHYRTAFPKREKN